MASSWASDGESVSPSMSGVRGKSWEISLMQAVVVHEQESRVDYKR